MSLILKSRAPIFFFKTYKFLFCNNYRLIGNCEISTWYNTAKQTTDFIQFHQILHASFVYILIYTILTQVSIHILNTTIKK
jgi:hypothetical protein